MLSPFCDWTSDFRNSGLIATRKDGKRKEKEKQKEKEKGGAKSAESIDRDRIRPRVGKLVNEPE